MRYLIIGLGIFGENLARDLTDAGHEVIGADSDQTHVDQLKDYLSTVYLLDSTEESSLAVLPLTNVDVVIVAIGENFGASVRTVALLKQAGVKHIYARAGDKIHEAVLEGFHVDRILTPEQRAASDITREMELGAGVSTLEVDKENIVVTFGATRTLTGVPYAEMPFEKDFGLKLIAVARPRERTNVVGIVHRKLENVTLDDTTLCETGDRLTIFGNRKKIQSFFRRISQQSDS